MSEAFVGESCSEFATDEAEEISFVDPDDLSSSLVILIFWLEASTLIVKSGSLTV